MGTSLLYGSIWEEKESRYGIFENGPFNVPEI